LAYIVKNNIGNAFRAAENSIKETVWRNNRMEVNSKDTMFPQKQIYIVRIIFRKE
jgi:hypothetical protein